MADALTTRYGLVKPEVGASQDTWGGKLNVDFDDVDALLGAITTTGSANAYVLTTGLSLNSSPAAYVTGQSFLINANFTNTGAATINVDTLGAKNITKNGATALVAGDIVSGSIYRIAYDGTQFQIVGVLVPTTVLTQGVVEIFIPAGAMTARTTNGAAAGTVESTTNKVMQVTKDFDQTTQEFVQFPWFPPKSWNLGTVSFIPVCIPAGSSGGWVFGMAGVAVSNDDVIDAAFGTAQTSTDSFLANTDVHVGPESSAITIAGTPAAADFVVFQINRTVADGGDTHNGDVKLLGIKLRYTLNAANDT